MKKGLKADVNGRFFLRMCMSSGLTFRKGRFVVMSTKESTIAIADIWEGRGSD